MFYEKNFANFTLLHCIPMDFWNDSQKISRNIHKKSFSKNEIIHFNGNLCKTIDIIVSGIVVVERIDETGNMMKITEFFPNDILGGNLIFSKSPYYPMTVTAKTSVTIISLQKSLVFELCSSYPDFLQIFLEYMSDHALLLGNTIKRYVNRSIRESLLAYLQNEYLLQQTNIIVLHSSKKELADRIGVSRTSISRELQKMKTEGLVHYDSKTITVLDLSIFD